MTTKRKHLLILDANVLIDFYKCDNTLIKLICSHVGQIYLSVTTLSEINEIDEGICSELGIILVEPELDQVILASAEKGPLSFQDNLCLLLAKEHGWTCVTNDKPLRRRCELKGVPLIWGIELICLLVENGGLSIEHAKAIILQIQQNNPRYITEDVVQKAFKRLK